MIRQRRIESEALDVAAANCARLIVAGDLVGVGDAGVERRELNRNQVFVSEETGRPNPCAVDDEIGATVRPASVFDCVEVCIQSRVVVENLLSRLVVPSEKPVEVVQAVGIGVGLAEGLEEQIADRAQPALIFRDGGFLHVLKRIPETMRGGIAQAVWREAAEFAPKDLSWLKIIS